MTKGLKEGQYLVYDVKVNGAKKSSKSDLSGLIQQVPNTRIPLLNTSAGISIYRFGEWIYDSSRHINKQAEFLTERDGLRLIGNEKELTKKQIKRLNKINDNLTSLEKKLEFGNFFMRTGNPRVIFDSTLTL